VDDYRFRDVRSGQGPVNIGRGNRAAGRDYQDNRSWSYEDRRNYRQGDNYDVQVGPGDPLDAISSGRGIGRLLTVIGLLVALGGFAGVGWLIVSNMMSLGPDTGPENPFAKELQGIPVLPVALVAFLGGTILSAVGAAMAKAARRRHDRRMRQRRGYY
jgi:hypothetical protein